MQVRGISLLSGGLDSILATLLVVRQGVPVTAVKFLTPFGCDATEGSSCGFDASSLAQRFGFELKLCPMGQEYADMVRNPPHGRGRNMNPCVDCRILMLRWARDLLDETGARFLITGEVVDQRPMSQTLPRLREIERETGLEGLILRPLSARLLPVTIPEREGWVDRDRLEAIRGRSRRRQLELAREFGLRDGEFGQPAGGCLLTDPGFSERLRDLWEHDPEAGISDIQLLKLGRHFRANGRAKIVVGRNQAENRAIRALRRDSDVLFEAVGVPGPTVLLRGSRSEDLIRAAAALARRYSDAKAAGTVRIDDGAAERELRVEQNEVDEVLGRLHHVR